MLEPKNNDELPAIPGKRYFTIGEVSELCGVKPHVLRYWEQEFPQLKPVKRRGNRRYYQRQDVHHHPSDPQPAVRAGLHDRWRAQQARRRRGPHRHQPEPADRPAGAPGTRRSAAGPAPLTVSISAFGRGVAQPGSALAWGARGRRFKSSRPDQYQYPESTTRSVGRHENIPSASDADFFAGRAIRNRAQA